MAPRKVKNEDSKEKTTPEGHTDDTIKPRTNPSPVDHFTDTKNDSCDDSHIDGDLIDNISPVKELNAALNSHKDSEKRAFDILIKENVILERERKKDGEKYQQLLAKYEVKNIELAAERTKTEHLERRLSEMQSEMTDLIKAAKKQGITRKGQAKGKGKATEPAVDYTVEPGDCGLSDNETREDKVGDAQCRLSTKVHDLELRLLRLTEEDECKSRLLVTLQRDLANSAGYINELEKHVDEKVREDLSKDKESSPDATSFTTVGKPTNTVYTGRPQAYSYKQNLAKDSVVCVIS